jgi:lipopolysaccharide transport system permease protein
MVVFTVIFSRIAKLPSDGSAPYPILVFTGMLPWFLFSGIIGDVSSSVISNAGLISKTYFPRLIIPLARAAAALVDFIVNLVMLALLMIYFGFAPGSHVFLLPAFVLMALAASLGPAMWIASVSVKYRDFTFITPFLLQLGLYVSPVGFSSAMVPDDWRLLYSLNPLVGIIDGFRWCILGGESQFYWPGIIISLLAVSVFFWIGLRTFRVTERSFADLI